MALCSSCGCEIGIELHYRKVAECKRCHRQTSITSATLCNSSSLMLLKWFQPLFFIGSGEGNFSALRLSKLIEVNWRTVRLI